MLGMVALVIIGCSGGDDEEPTPNPTTPPEATSAPQPTATSKPSVPGDSGTTEDGAGTLEVRVTDAPDPSITAVYVTTSNIEVSIAGDEGGWETVIDEEITFELLALEGVEAVLGTAELPTGRKTTRAKHRVLKTRTLTVVREVPDPVVVATPVEVTPAEATKAEAIIPTSSRT